MLLLVLLQWVPMFFQVELVNVVLAAKILHQRIWWLEVRWQVLRRDCELGTIATAWQNCKEDKIEVQLKSSHVLLHRQHAYGPLARIRVDLPHSWGSWLVLLRLPCHPWSVLHVVGEVRVSVSNSRPLQLNQHLHAGFSHRWVQQYNYLICVKPSLSLSCPSMSESINLANSTVYYPFLYILLKTQLIMDSNRRSSNSESDSTPTELQEKEAPRRKKKVLILQSLKGEE